MAQVAFCPSLPLSLCVSIVLYSLPVQYELGRMISGDRHGRLPVHVTAAAVAAVQRIEQYSQEKPRGAPLQQRLLWRH